MTARKPRRSGKPPRGKAAPSTTSTRIIHPSGAVRWLASKGEVFINSDGKPAWAAGAIFDITELGQAQQELTAREARYRALSQMNAIGEWIAAPDGSVLSCQFWAEFTGQRESDARGLGWLEAVHPQDRDAVVASWGEALRIASSMEFVYRARHRSGAFRWIRSKAIPIKNADGTVASGSAQMRIFMLGGRWKRPFASARSGTGLP